MTIAEHIRIWFYANWMYAGLVAAVFLFALVPVVAAPIELPLLLVYLASPVYMVHQVEEHAGDRFRRFANEHMGHGRELLTTPAVVFINVPLVWGMNLLALYLARFVDPGLGLIAVYLLLVNALVHIVGAAVLRIYNPGLVTAVILFLPLSIWALAVLGPGAGLWVHILALGIAIALHAAIVAYVRQRYASLAAVPPGR